MLPDKLKKYLFDIKEAIDAIETIKSKLPDINTLQSDRILRSALERELILIGEVATKIIAEFPEIYITDIVKIKDTRNIIVHDYDNVNHRIIWSIIHEHILLQKMKLKIY